MDLKSPCLSGLKATKIVDICIIFVWTISLKHGPTEVCGRIITQSHSTATKIDTEQHSLECTSDSRNLIQWHYRSPGSAINKIIFNGFGMNETFGERFSVEEEGPGSWILTIGRLQLLDAGTYMCVEGTTDQLVTFELVVLASNPMCTTNLRMLHQLAAVEEFQNIFLTCSVAYAGNWAPVMSWQRDGGEVITDGVVNNTVAYKSVTYSLTVLATRNLTGNKYNCTTYFTEDNNFNKPKGTSATNVPDYMYTWKAVALNISYAPERITIHPSQYSYHIGDQLTCSANGNPTPIYRWKNLKTGEITPGPILIVARVLSGSQNTFECIVTNVVSTTSKSITFDVTNLDTLTYGIAGFVAAIVVVLTVIGIILCCRKNTKDKLSKNVSADCYKEDTETDLAHQSSLEPVQRYNNDAAIGYELINQETRNIPSDYTRLTASLLPEASNGEDSNNAVTDANVIDVQVEDVGLTNENSLPASSEANSEDSYVNSPC